MTVQLSRTVTVSIDRQPADVLTYVRDPENLPAWAAGFALSVRLDGDQWRIRTTSGEVTVSFVPENDFGIADHLVADGSGSAVLNPVRVLPNADGSEVLFTLFAPDAADLARDATLVAADLARLKAVLEGP